MIYLFMCGGPSHIDTFDYKPSIRKIHGQELPDSIRRGQRLTGMTSGQKKFPCVAPMFEFQRCIQFLPICLYLISPCFVNSRIYIITQ